jgi:hypothetical protein
LAAAAGQKVSDADPAASESDELSALKDQAASDRDQATADRLQASGDMTDAEERAYRASRKDRDMVSFEHHKNRMDRARTAIKRLPWRVVDGTCRPFTKQRLERASAQVLPSCATAPTAHDAKFRLRAFPLPPTLPRIQAFRG